MSAIQCRKYSTVVTTVDSCTVTLSYHCKIQESVLLTIGESVTVNLDNVFLDKQSHYSLEVIEYQTEFCDSQPAFTNTIEINEKCRKINSTSQKSVTSLKKKIFFLV